MMAKELVTSNIKAGSLIEVPKPFSHPEGLFETHIKSYSSSLRLETEKGDITNLTCLIGSVSKMKSQNKNEPNHFYCWLIAKV